MNQPSTPEKESNTLFPILMWRLAALTYALTSPFVDPFQSFSSQEPRQLRGCEESGPGEVFGGLRGGERPEHREMHHQNPQAGQEEEGPSY